MNLFVKSDENQGVLTLRLDRPEKYNALTNAMYTELACQLRVAQCNDNIRVVVFTGGPHCFTSGNDLIDFLEAPPQDLDAPAFDFMRAVLELRKPLIAAVCGPAIGIGMTLLPHCDLVYVTQASKLAMPFIKLGLCQEFAASVTMPAVLGSLRANQLLLAGEAITGTQAAEWGLANTAFADAQQCLEAAKIQASRFAAMPQKALRVGRDLLRQHSNLRYHDILEAENLAFIAQVQSAETREALQSMLKRS